ncbi:MAG: hypothetical protein ACYCX6_10860 [Vulcanimicrobiaceae bacterium]
MKIRMGVRSVAIAAGLALAAFLTVGFILAGREPVPNTPNSQPIVLKGGHVSNHRIDTKSWSFDYKRAEQSPNGSVATITGIHNGILFRKGKPYLRISAQEVSINTASLDFTAIGDVHIESANPKANDGRSFDTDLVEWEDGLKHLAMPHPSIVRTRGQTLKVDSITVDFKKGLVTLEGVHGGIHLSR